MPSSNTERDEQQQQPAQVWRAHAEHTTTAGLRHFPERALSAARALPSVFSGETDSPPSPLLLSSTAARTTTNHRGHSARLHPSPPHTPSSSSEESLSKRLGPRCIYAPLIRGSGLATGGDARYRTAEGLVKRAISRCIHIRIYIRTYH